MSKENWTDKIDFKNIYRSKGKSGVFAYMREFNNGMIGVSSFETLKGSIVSRQSLERLSDYFYESEKGVISMKQMFGNLSRTKKDIYTLDLRKVMEIAVPKHTSTFKPYHMEMILKWYKLIELTVNQIKEANGENETT